MLKRRNKMSQFREVKKEMYTAYVYVDNNKRIQNFYKIPREEIEKYKNATKLPELKKSKTEALEPLF